MPKFKDSRYFSAFKFLFQYIMPHKYWYFAASAIAFLLTGMNLLQTKVTAALVNSSVSGKSSGILISVCFFIAIILINIALHYFSTLSVSKLSAYASKDLKRDICGRLLSAQYSDIVSLKTGDALQTVNSDTAVICNFLAGDFIGLFSEFIMALGALIYLITVSPMLCLVTFVYTPLGMFFTLTINKKTNVLYPKAADFKGEALSAVEQALTCIPVIKSFMMEKQIKKRVFQQYDRVCQTEMKISVWESLLQPACSSTAMTPQMLYLLFGGYLVMKSGLSVGSYIAVCDLLIYIIGPTVMLPFMLNSLNAAIASINRVKKLFELKTDETLSKKRYFPQQSDLPVENHETLNITLPSIQLSHFTFCYDNDEPLLRDFCFSYHGAGIVAVCGESGCGKTTLFDLISGLLKPQSGKIEINGEIGFVAQDTFLFNATVLENIRLGNTNASDREIIKAAKEAGADEFIMALQSGYQTLLGDGNIELSGGQKQRIALARLLLGTAPVWILDEPTSALDRDTENLIIDVLKRKSKEKLILYSAHRKSLIDCADRVVYLKGAERFEKTGNEIA